MKKGTFLVYTGYVGLKSMIGFAFHPYRSVLDTMRHPVIFPVIFSPIVSLIFLMIITKIGAILIKVYGMQRELIAIFLSTALISVTLWQTLLIYLLISFLIASWKEN